MNSQEQIISQKEKLKQARMEYPTDNLCQIYNKQVINRFYCLDIQEFAPKFCHECPNHYRGGVNE